MSASMPSEWHDFYALLGTASAALVALLFVAVSVGATLISPDRSTATRTFMSPVVFHYSSILLLSLIVLIPNLTPPALAFAIALLAVIGMAYTTFVMVELARASISDVADRFGYGLLPLAPYLGMLAAAGLTFVETSLSADILAGSLLLLLAVNIRNAWDLLLAFARRIATQRPGP